MPGSADRDQYQQKGEQQKNAALGGAAFFYAL